jgi:pimeloyl-ACP methyl ester carboxylesterase
VVPLALRMNGFQAWNWSRSESTDHTASAGASMSQLAVTSIMMSSPAAISTPAELAISDGSSRRICAGAADGRSRDANRPAVPGCYDEAMSRGSEPSSTSFIYRGRRIGYCEHGAGPRTIVLIHGLLMDSRMYTQLAPMLAAHGHRVIRADMLGHGTSDQPHAMTDYSMPQLGLHRGPAGHGSRAAWREVK